MIPFHDRVRANYERLPINFFTLWDLMTHLNLTVLTEGLSALKAMEEFLRDEKLSEPTEQSWAQLTEKVVALRELLRQMNLTTSTKGADRLFEKLEQRNPGPSRDHIRDLVSSLAITTKDEMGSVVAYQVAADLIPYLYPQPFDPMVHSKFFSVSHEIEEAGRCISFELNTAAVFHLMRAMEAGLRALGKALAVEDKNPSWDSILSKCGIELEKRRKERSPAWLADEEFYSTAAAHLRAVKDVWRNPTMHLENRYDQRKAREIWGATQAFMRHLATKLTDEE